VFILSIVAPHCAAVFWKLCRDDVVNDVVDDDDDAAKTCRMMLFV